MDMIISAFLVWVYMTSWYVVSRIQKRNDIADTAWGIGFVVVALYRFTTAPSLTSLITFILVFLWGTRLALHIHTRNKNKKEDKRYKQFKDSPYLKVFMTQGCLLWLISWPIIFSGNTLHWYNLVGIFVWVFGFYFETRADRELREFLKTKKKGEIMQKGLWALSRHPNYFGEVTLWWGIWLLTLQEKWWTIIGPLTITYLITKVSGIPLLEKRYEGNRAYEKYKKKTPVFCPKLPK